jgi:hypothetical protein
MSNNRIFYACQAVAFGEFVDNQLNPDALEVAHGVQSVGINTSFNLEQAFELGQISIYENIEGLPDVEVTIEKVLDGYPLLYHLATTGAAEDTLVSRTKKRCNVALGIYPDDEEFIDGNAPVQVFMSGMYINSISYTFPTDGPSTESVTLVGNSKTWGSSAFGSAVADGLNDGDDFPKASGGIQRREDVMMSSCIMPVSIYGIDDTSAGNNWDITTRRPKAHIQSITISTDLGREDILELGHKEPYYRTATFPVEVTSEFEVIAISGDFVSAYVNGDNTPEQPIKIVLRDGTEFDLGTKNRLSSVNYTGGDAGGGNATTTYSFSTFNDLTVTEPSIFQI